MSVQQYLQHYAEDAIKLSDKISKYWQQVICVPAFNEQNTLQALINRIASEQALLFILVLNTPDTASAEIKNTSLAQAQILKQQLPLQEQLHEQACLLKLNEQGTHLLLLEDYAIPAKQGVGLARKTACDLACKLIAMNKVSSPWIYNTDADVLLPDDYFSVQADANYAAVLFPFQHVINIDADTELAMRLYDYSLHYYVNGLQWAQSPYAYHTIGSTLVINHEHYALARGFPKRAGAEDFYLLNKLAKIGAIKILDSPTITLSGRRSERVPFGTGPAINRITRLQNPQHDFLFYHPHCFDCLRQWLGVIPSLWADTTLTHLENTPHLVSSLHNLGVENAISHAQKHANNQQTFIRHMHNWFDAFRTLKLIHELRDRGLESINQSKLQTYQNQYSFIPRST